jgi:bifunctional DNase/RNase
MIPILRALAAIILAAPLGLSAGPTLSTESPAEADRLVRVQGIEVMPSPGGPVVVLKIGNRSIPVFIEPLVAHSIQMAIAGQTPARPLTHDLMHTILESLDAKVTQVVLTLKDGVYRGALTISVAGQPKVFDARSSDAIALAVRFSAPILLDPALVESVGVERRAEPRPDPT